MSNQRTAGLHANPTIQAGVQHLRRELEAAGAGPVQVEEMSRAFYIGASHMLGLIIEMEDRDLSDDAVAAIIASWVNEARDFLIGFKASHDGRHQH